MGKDENCARVVGCMRGLRMSGWGEKGGRREGKRC